MARDAFDKLTERQKQCLRLVASGQRSKTIGAALGISHLTVNQHIEAAKAKLGASTREDAAQLLLRYEREAYPEGITTVPQPLADERDDDGDGASEIADVVPPPGPRLEPLTVREEQTPYRASGLGLEDLLRLPLRHEERPRNDLSTLDTLFAVAKLVILLAVAALVAAAVVETMSKIGANLG